MMGLDVGGTFEVGDSTGEPEDAVVGAGRELEAVDDFAEHGHVFGGGSGILTHEGGCHLGIAMDARVFLVALLLNLTGFDDPLTDGGRGFTRLGTAELVKRQGRYLDLQVYTVE